MDSILGIGLPELIFIAVLALIFLGPERLPGTLRQIARAWGYARNLGRELTAQFSEEFKELEDLNPRKLLNDLADEELAKDLKSLNANSKKTAAATRAVSTTTKPGAKPGASATTKTTNAATSRPSAAAPKGAKPLSAAKTGEQQAAVKSAERMTASPDGKSAATEEIIADGEQTRLLPDAQSQATATPAEVPKTTELAGAG